MIDQWVRDLILKTVDPWVVQEPNMSKEELLSAAIIENNEGYNYFVGSKKTKTCLLVAYNTYWVADIHLFSDNKNPWEIVKTIKKAQEYIFNNSNFRKLEMRTHLKPVCKLAERCGWFKEGEHPGAIKLEDGTFVTEYSYGITNE